MIISIPLAVKEVNSEIVISVKNSAGSEIAAKTANAATYLASLGTDATYKTLPAKLVAYGSAADVYFNDPESAVAPATDPSFGDSTFERSDSRVDGITHKSASLLLESKTTIRHYFELDADTGLNIEFYTFYVDYDMDGGYDADEELDAKYNEENGLYYVDIKNITPNDIDRPYTIYVTDRVNTYYCSYSALDYARRVYSSGENATKALVAALFDYLSAASEVGANIIYKDGETTLKTVLYNYGVDNYLDYAPTKSDAVFAGWKDASGNAVNCISANTTGDVTLTASWMVTSIVPSTQKFNDNIMNAVQTTSGYVTVDTSNRDSQGYVLYDYSNFVYNLTNLSQNYASGYNISATPSNPIDAIKGVETDLFEFSIELGRKDSTTSVLPLRMRIGGSNGVLNEQFFTVESDGSVYLTPNKSDYYKIAELDADGSLTTVKFYIDFSGIPADKVSTSNPATNPNTGASIGDGASKVGTINIYATNTAGKLISVTSMQANISSYAIGQILFGRSTTTLGTNLNEAYAIKIGNCDIKPVTNVILDVNAGVLDDSINFETPTVLPKSYEKSGYEFNGWYADAEFTKPINSIPAGTFGVVKVYPKWTQIKALPTNAMSNTTIGQFGTGGTLFSGRVLGNDMIGTGTADAPQYSKFTIRVDLATDNTGWDSESFSSSTLRWQYGYVPDGYNSGLNNNHMPELNIVGFKDNALITEGGTYLVRMNQDVVLDVVVDTANQTLSYYVDGFHIVTEHSDDIQTDLYCYNHKNPPATGYTANLGISSGSAITMAFQLQTLSGRTFRYDSFNVYLDSLH